MTNADMAVELIINYLESENIYVGTAEIRSIVEKWEVRLDPIDFISLAAVAISNPNENALTISEIREMREFYFPSKNYLERSFYF